MIRVGLEIPAPRSREPYGAWVLDLIGCYSSAASEEDALAGVPAAIDAYLEHARDLGAIAPRGSVQVVERFTGWWEGTYEVSAFFRQFDLAPVTSDEVAFADALLERTRRALLDAATVAGPGTAGDREVGAVLRRAIYHELDHLHELRRRATAGVA